MTNTDVSACHDDKTKMTHFQNLTEYKYVVSDRPDVPDQPEKHFPLTGSLFSLTGMVQRGGGKRFPLTGRLFSLTTSKKHHDASYLTPDNLINSRPLVFLKADNSPH